MTERLPSQKPFEGLLGDTFLRGLIDIADFNDALDPFLETEPRHNMVWLKQGYHLSFVFTEPQDVFVLGPDNIGIELHLREFDANGFRIRWPEDLADGNERVSINLGLEEPDGTQMFTSVAPEDIVSISPNFGLVTPEDEVQILEDKMVPSNSFANLFEFYDRLADACEVVVDDCVYKLKSGNLFIVKFVEPVTASFTISSGIEIEEQIFTITAVNEMEFELKEPEGEIIFRDSRDPNNLRSIVTTRANVAELYLIDDIARERRPKIEDTK